MSITIECFKAKNGDSLLISIGEFEKINILIDGGYKETYLKILKQRLKELNQIGEKLDLVIVSHIDSDHIEGIVEFLKENGDSSRPNIIEIGDIWHNSYKHLPKENTSEITLSKEEISVLNSIITSNMKKYNIDSNENININATQGSILAKIIKDNNYKLNKAFQNKAACVENKKVIKLNKEINITLLGPSLENLKELKKYWHKELRRKKFDFLLTEDELFESAFEVYLKYKNTEDLSIENKDISKKNQSEDLGEYYYNENNSDKSHVNLSSISFIIEYLDYKLLFLGDSNPDCFLEDLIKSNKVFFDFLKVSHHGSKKNTSKKFLEKIDSKIFLISTNGDYHNHPHVETISRIVCRKTHAKRNLVFNYFQSNRIWDLELNKTKYNYESLYPLNEDSIYIKYNGNNIEVI